MGSRTEGVRRAWGPLEFYSAVEKVGDESKWALRSERHTLKVLREGLVHGYSAEVGDTVAKSCDLRPGSMSLVPAGHAYRSQGRGETIAFSVFSFPANSGVEPILDQRDEFVCSTVHRLHEAASDHEERLAEALGHALYLHLETRYVALPEPDSLNAIQKRRLQKYIDANLGTRPTVSDLAQQVGMGRSRFSAAFRTAFGATPALYVLHLRLAKAQSRLATGPCDLSELAYELGFASHSHLTNAFKARFGYPPREAARRGFLPSADSGEPRLSGPS